MRKSQALPREHGSTVSTRGGQAPGQSRAGFFLNATKADFNTPLFRPRLWFSVAHLRMVCGPAARIPTRSRFGRQGKTQYPGYKAHVATAFAPSPCRTPYLAAGPRGHLPPAVYYCGPTRRVLFAYPSLDAARASFHSCPRNGEHGHSSEAALWQVL